MEWISVNDRLPEPKFEKDGGNSGGKWKESEMVLIVGSIDVIDFDDSENRMITAICCYDEGDEDNPYFAIPGGYAMRATNGKITHWMPIPEPPIKGGRL